jgi:hypothetical protein
MLKVTRKNNYSESLKEWRKSSRFLRRICNFYSVGAVLYTEKTEVSMDCCDYPVSNSWSFFLVIPELCKCSVYIHSFNATSVTPLQSSTKNLKFSQVLCVIQKRNSYICCDCYHPPPPKHWLESQYVFLLLSPENSDISVWCCHLLGSIRTMYRGCYAAWINTET